MFICLAIRNPLYNFSCIFTTDTNDMYSIIDTLWYHYKTYMNINNPHDAYHFLVSNGLVGLCPESQNLVACVDQLVRMCACDSDESKRSKYNQCVQNYVQFAAKSRNFANNMLAKSNDSRLSFYLNNQLIGSITR